MIAGHATAEGTARYAARLVGIHPAHFRAMRDGEGVSSLGLGTYLGEEDVSGRGIHRHGGDVARVRYFAVTTAAGKRYLLVHLTAEGSLTDYDVVDR